MLETISKARWMPYLSQYKHFYLLYINTEDDGARKKKKKKTAKHSKTNKNPIII